jgi:MinD-like ATPase involved in chromosome partitioning or flagellar assembly
LGKIPYDPAFTKAMIEGKTVLEYDPESKASKAVMEIWDRTLRAPEMNTITELVLS